MIASIAEASSARRDCLLNSSRASCGRAVISCGSGISRSSFQTEVVS